MGAASHPTGSANGDIKLENGVVYMIEYEIRMITATTYRPYAWISDADGNELYGPSDFWTLDLSSGPFNMADEQVDFGVNNIADFGDQNCGSNGWNDDPVADYVAWYFGGVMIRTEGRPGPFDSAEQSF